MSNFVSSDYHLGHGNIIKLAKRPFKDLNHMNETIIKNHNERIKNDDTFFHVGDFCFRNSPGGKDGEGTTTRATNYLEVLNGQKVLIKGNHDKNNTVKTCIERIYVNFGGYRICMVHSPSHVDYKCKVNLVGHVHGEWKFMRFERDGRVTYAVNVGVDQWNFRPITIDEALIGLDKWKKKERERKELLKTQISQKEVRPKERNNLVNG